MRSMWSYGNKMVSCKNSKAESTGGCCRWLPPYLTELLVKACGNLTERLDRYGFPAPSCTTCSLLFQLVMFGPLNWRCMACWSWKPVCIIVNTMSYTRTSQAFSRVPTMSMSLLTSICLIPEIHQFLALHGRCLEHIFLNTQRFLHLKTLPGCHGSSAEDVSWGRRKESHQTWRVICLYMAFLKG